MAGIAFGRRHRVRVGVALLAAMLAVLGVPQIAAADPDGNTPQALVEALEAASRAYYETQSVLAASQERQAVITENLQIAQDNLARLSEQIGHVAAARYKGGTVGLFNGMISGQTSREDLLAGAAVGEFLLWRDDTYIREYRILKDESERQQGLLTAELDIQTRQAALLDAQKREAEKALAAVGGLPVNAVGGPAQPAQPAPRNADGSFPWEDCSIDDATSGGCLTPRTYHMVTEAKFAGFTRYVGCWRASSWGEHPQGRACDFSATEYGFAGYAATGNDREYGNQLANWAVSNASALGVLYVIWYQQVWFPGSGWRAYGSYGDPATEHTNHVHISML
jgi:hypothetical protein